jgi:hypothetical protein
MSVLLIAVASTVAVLPTAVKIPRIYPLQQMVGTSIAVNF